MCCVAPAPFAETYAQALSCAAPAPCEEHIAPAASYTTPSLTMEGFAPAVSYTALAPSDDGSTSARGCCRRGLPLLRHTGAEAVQETDARRGDDNHQDVLLLLTQDARVAERSVVVSSRERTLASTRVLDAEAATAFDHGHVRGQTALRSCSTSHHGGPDVDEHDAKLLLVMTTSLQQPFTSRSAPQVVAPQSFGGIHQRSDRNWILLLQSDGQTGIFRLLPLRQILCKSRLERHGSFRTSSFVGTSARKSSRLNSVWCESSHFFRTCAPGSIFLWEDCRGRFDDPERGSRGCCDVRWGRISASAKRLT